MMSYFLSIEAQNWDTCLPYAVLAYRTTPHTVTEYSPHYLMYGQELKLPIEDDLRVIIQKSIPGNYDKHVINLARKLKQVYEIVRKENRRGQRHSKRYYDKRAHVREFNLGDLVYMTDPFAKHRPKKKFADKWGGPYEIIEKLSQLTYRVRKNNGYIMITHINQLKVCQSKPVDSVRTNDEPQLDQSNKIGDTVTLNKENFESVIKRRDQTMVDLWGKKIITEKQ